MHVFTSKLAVFEGQLRNGLRTLQICNSQMRASLPLLYPPHTVKFFFHFLFVYSCLHLKYHHYLCKWLLLHVWKKYFVIMYTCIGCALLLHYGSGGGRVMSEAKMFCLEENVGSYGWPLMLCSSKPSSNALLDLVFIVMDLFKLLLIILIPKLLLTANLSTLVIQLHNIFHGWLKQFCIL